MKVVKINKSYRCNTKEHFLVLLDESYSNEHIVSLVEEWCDTDVCGMNGYDYEWCFVEDEELINNILKNKIKVVDDQIEALKAKKCEMEKYLK